SSCRVPAPAPVKRRWQTYGKSVSAGVGGPLVAQRPVEVLAQLLLVRFEPLADAGDGRTLADPVHERLHEVLLLQFDEVAGVMNPGERAVVARLVRRNPRQDRIDL